MQAGYGGNQRLLDLVAQFGCRVQRPGGGQVQVHGDEVALPGGACHHVVEKDFTAVLGVQRFKALQRIVNQLVYFRAGGAVHQPLAGAMNQPPAFAQDVEGNQNGHQRIQPLPARDHDQCDAANDAEGGVHVGEQVLAVGFQRDGLVEFGSFEQRPGHNAIEQGADDGQRNPPIDLLQRLGVQQPHGSRPENAQRRSKNQHALKTG